MSESIRIEIKHRYTGEVLFAHECDENSIKRTVEEAVRKGISIDYSNLSYSDLSGSNLRGCNLRGCDLSGSDLSYSNLSYSDLRGCNLSGSDLSGSNLSYSDLSGSNLSGSNIRGCNLSGSDLRGCNLRGSNLRGSNLSGSDLRGCNLSGSDLSGSDLSGCKNTPFIPTNCPSDGAFVGWKKVGNKLVKMIIPSNAKRSSATSRKCRAEFVEVIEITDLDGTNPIEEIANTSRIPHTLYKVGEITKADSWDENRFNECSHGIHFFINKQEAIDYEF